LGPLPFKYNHIWNGYQGVKELVQQTWRQHVEGSPCFIWESKLKNVKKALKNWAKTQYIEPEEKQREVKTKIEDLHYVIEKQAYQQAEKIQEESLYNQRKEGKRKKNGV